MIRRGDVITRDVSEMREEKRKKEKEKGRGRGGRRMGEHEKSQLYRRIIKEREGGGDKREKGILLDCDIF